MPLPSFLLKTRRVNKYRWSFLHIPPQLEQVPLNWICLLQPFVSKLKNSAAESPYVASLSKPRPLNLAASFTHTVAKSFLELEFLERSEVTTCLIPSTTNWSIPNQILHTEGLTDSGVDSASKINCRAWKCPHK